MQCISNKIVILFDIGDFEEAIARYYAKMLNVECVSIKGISLLEKFIQTTAHSSISIFAPAQYFSLKNITTINDAMQKNNDEIKIGYFPSGDAELLLFLVVKDICYTFTSFEEKLSLLRLTNRELPVRSDASKLTMYNQSSSTLQNIADYFDKHFCVVASFLGHGRDDLFWLSKHDVICGKNNCKVKMQDKAIVPGCRECNKCFEPNSEIIFASSLKVENIFLYACNSLKLYTSLFASEYTMAYGMLSGYVRTMIGTVTTAAGVEILNTYYLRLMECGFSVGEIVILLNRFFYEYKISFAVNLLLVGNPDTTMGDAKRLFEAYYICGVGDKITICVDVENVSIVRIYLRNFEKCDMELYINFESFIIIENVIVSKYYKLLGHNSRGWYVDILSINGGYPKSFDFKMINLGFKFISKNSFVSLLHDLNLNINRDYSNTHFRMMSKKRKMQANFRSLNSSFSHDERTLMEQVKQIQEMDEYLSDIALEYLVRKGHANGFRWEEYCYDIGYQIKNSGEPNFSICPACKAEAYVVKFEHPHYAQHARSHYYCDRCGVVFDAPYGEENMLSISMKAEKYKIGQSNSIEIAIKHSGKPIESCRVGFAILWGEDYGVSYENNLQQVNFDVDGVGVMNGTIILPPDLVPHIHPLKVYIILADSLYSYRYNLWIEK